jgi:hypothetical protein
VDLNFDNTHCNLRQVRVINHQIHRAGNILGLLALQ